MELQLKQRTLDCLKQLTNQIRQEEQTQEIKLGDTMPDVGRVLGTWGRCSCVGNNGIMATRQYPGV